MIIHVSGLYTVNRGTVSSGRKCSGFRYYACSFLLLAEETVRQRATIPVTTVKTRDNGHITVTIFSADEPGTTETADEVSHTSRHTANSSQKGKIFIACDFMFLPLIKIIMQILYSHVFHYARHTHKKSV